MLAFNDSNAPWENARTESKGGKFKLALQKAAHMFCPCSYDEWLLLLMETSAAGHELQNLGGYSPNQLVFGKNPRVPPQLCDVPLGREGDTAESSFKRAAQIREAARQGWMQAEADVLLTPFLRRLHGSVVQLAPDQYTKAWLCF